MQLTEGQKSVLSAEGHLLVTGGPGSGKTTISIMKAAQIASRDIRPGQNILFLSFARATVSRVIEAIEQDQTIKQEQKQKIEVDTYHSFFWQILKAHGYLLGLPRRLDILTPQSEAIALSKIRSQYPKKNLTSEQKDQKKRAEDAERYRLAHEDGRLCFDYFASYVAKLLSASNKLRKLLGTMYPVIILDEFQDTNDDQWAAVLELGKCSRLISLADPEQRIYEWLGADPERLDHFMNAFNPAPFDLSTDNHRSAGTDITKFGNDILHGKFRQKEYVGIEVDTFESIPLKAITKLITSVYSARSRLLSQHKPDWSLAILVPTKKMTRLVSEALHEPPAKLTPVSHSASIDMDAAILAAEVIAHLMQPADEISHLSIFVDLICNYFQGKGGNEPTQKALKEAERYRKAYAEYLTKTALGKPIRKTSVLIKAIEAHNSVRNCRFNGDPDSDWNSIRKILTSSTCQNMKEIAEEVRNIRLLVRGSHLRKDLANNWREYGSYTESLEIFRGAFVQEHFSRASKPESGVVVMNMHKAKGKQFDEVIIFEGWPRWAGREIVANTDRIVWNNSKENANNQARQNFRVSITRGKQKTTILTPVDDCCVLLRQ